MANPYPNRYSQHFRQPSTVGPSGLGGSQQSPALVARINEKKQELENLIALRELSAALASQMQQLEEKLETLTDGTEGCYPIDLGRFDLY
jgi:DASH complex subunit DAD2